jgi:hypothetical protein
MQFAWLTRTEARAFLKSADPVDGNYGDRVAMDRRANRPVTTAAERARVRAYNEAHGYDRTGQKITPPIAP